MEKEKTSFWKENWKTILCAFFVGVIITPLCISIGIRVIDWIPWLNRLPGSDQDWIGFWGGFMGSVVGVAGAIYIFQKQIDVERENNKQQLEAERELTQEQINESRQQIKDEKIDNTFFNLINLHIRNKEIIPVFRKKDSFKCNPKALEDLLKGEGTENADDEINLFSTILEEIPEQIKKDKQIKYIFKQKKYVLDNLDRIKRAYDQLNNEHDYFILLEHQKQFLNNLPQPLDPSSFTYFITQFLDLNSSPNGIVNENLKIIYDNQNEDLGKIYCELMQLPQDELTYEEKRMSCTKVISYYYDSLGNYFRLVHRIFKFLNKNIERDIDRKLEYIGILRALFSEKELLVIFYNAFYTDKGQGMRDQLKNTNFFGEEKDLPLDSQDDLQHFINKNLIFEIDDIIFMRECCIPGFPPT